MTTYKKIDRLSDNAEAFAYVLHCFEEGKNSGFFPATRHTPTGDETVITASLDGEFIGFITFYQPYDDSPMMWLDLLWVAKSLRGQRLGYRLVSEAVKAAEKLGLKEVQVGTMMANFRMRATAHRAGFKEANITYSLRIGSVR